MKILLTLTAVMLFMSGISSAAVYYVDNLGNDNNTGLSESSPWKTISKVNSVSFAAGDEVLFKKGCTWYETLTVSKDNIKFGAYGTGSLPVFDAQMIRVNNIYMSGRSGVVIQDLNLINQAGSGSIRIKYSNNITVKNCEFYITEHGGIFIENSKNCLCSGNTMSTPSFIDTQTDGIYSQRNNGNIYENNYIVIYNSAALQHNDGIQCYLDTSITARNNYIEQNNLKTGYAQGIYATNTYGRFIWYNNIINTPNITSNSLGFKNLDSTLYKGTVEAYYNTVITHAGSGLCVQNAPDFIAKNNIFISTSTGYVVNIIGRINNPANLNYNIYYNSGTSGAAVYLQDYGGVHTIPMLQSKGYELNGMFANPLLGTDYTPLQNSPVLDKAIDLSLYHYDKNGTLRPQGLSPDPGAIERITAPVETVPQPPQNLSARADSTSRIILNWTDASNNELGFKLERQDGNWNQVAVLTSNSVTYTDTGLAPGTLYSYRICAYNNAGSSAYSNIAQASTDSIVVPALNDTLIFAAKSGYLYKGAALSVKQGSINDSVVIFTSRTNIAEYSVVIPYEDDWYIQGVFFQDVRSNPFAFQVNNNTKINFSNPKITGAWQYGPKILMGHLTSGVYKISISNSKPGTGCFLDQILITNNSKNSGSVSEITPGTEPLLQNYPNPFNPETTIRFYLNDNEKVVLQVYDILGNLVKVLADENMSQGYHEISFNASSLASGIYILHLVTEDQVSSIKLNFLK